MNEVKNKFRIYHTMLINLISVMLTSFIYLYLTPKITNSVGAEAYGFVSLARNFVTFANIIILALDSYAARYMTVAYVQNKDAEFKKYFNTVFWGDCIIGGLLFLAGIACTLRLEAMLNVPASLVADVKVMFVLTFMTFYVTTVSTVFLATGYVKDRLDLVNSIKGMSCVLEIVILYFAYRMLSPKVWYVGAAAFFAALTIFIGTVCITNKYLPGNKLSVSLFDKTSFKTLIVNGLWNSVNSMGNALNSGLDLLVSNVLLNALAMGQLSIAKTVSSMVHMVYAMLAQPFYPTFLKCYSSGNTGVLLKELKYSMKVCGIVANLIFAGFVVLGREFFSLWIPTQNIDIIYKLTLIAMLPCITEGCVYPIYYIYTLTVKNKVPSFVTVAGGIVNVAGMIVLVKYLNCGIYSIVWTTAFVMSVINLVTNPLYMSKCLNVKKSTFYPEIISNLISCACAVLIMKIAMLLFSAQGGWLYFILKIVFCVIIGIIAQSLIIFKPGEIKDVVLQIACRVKRH